MFSFECTYAYRVALLPERLSVIAQLLVSAAAAHKGTMNVCKLMEYPLQQTRIAKIAGVSAASGTHF
jgi:hypothetical protein